MSYPVDKNSNQPLCFFLYTSVLILYTRMQLVGTDICLSVYFDETLVFTPLGKQWWFLVHLFQICQQTPPQHHNSTESFYMKYRLYMEKNFLALKTGVLFLNPLWTIRPQKSVWRTISLACFLLKTNYRCVILQVVSVCIHVFLI